jgi:hypothetical protein
MGAKIKLRIPHNSKRANPHPGPLPSDGRGSANARLSNLRIPLLAIDAYQWQKRVAACSLSHRMGEGQGEGNKDAANPSASISICDQSIQNKIRPLTPVLSRFGGEREIS